MQKLKVKSQNLAEKYNPSEIEAKWPTYAKATAGKQNVYKPSEIEQKWQAVWGKEGIYKASDSASNKKFYTLIEFPYPSAAGLHVGHVRSWSAMDAYSRKKRMEGFNVLYPIGWDAFGLPAENYALKMKIHPSVAVKENIANFKRQIKNLGISFDWSREIDTTDPKYYKWTQWIFLKLFERGLAYQAKVSVNWCPFCKTNLADEEVLPDATHERCGKLTEKRLQKQWLLKITKYADRLIEDLKLVDFSERIAVQQVNWIGRSEGIQIEFKIQNSKFKITVFTTALDTIFGTSFMVIAPEMAKRYLSLVPSDYKKSVAKYIEDSLKKSELERQEEKKDKTGVNTGLKAINPFSGRGVPIFVADYILATYGTGAVMGVPGHDARDHEFAKKYNLPIIPVIKPSEKIKNETKVKQDGFWDYSEIKESADQAILFNSDNFSGLLAKEAKSKLEEELAKRGIGKKNAQYHLRDWVFSRQHYWGEPIPIIHCQKCGAVAVAEKDLPVELPYLDKYEPSGTGESPLANAKNWVNTKCPICGEPARRETDTMPNWAGSNWYFLRYLDPDNDGAIADREKMKYWMPVDLYQGGFEHTTLHLLYSRFVYKFLYDLKVVPTLEPYAKRRSHGIVLGSDGKKMSKSFGNVISPDVIVKKFGADTLRIYEMFMGPFDQMIAWSEEGVEGCFKFLKRVWHLATVKISQDKTSLSLSTELNKVIKKVGSDLENLKFNTAVAAMMGFINDWQKDEKGLDQTDLKRFLLVLSPFAPHLTEEIWSELGNKSSIHQESWPSYDPKLLVETEVVIAVQVNGKLRDVLKVQSSKCKVQSFVEQMARESAKVKKYLEGKRIKKVIYVEGKVINFVVN